MRRKINDRTFLTYLLQYVNVDKLKIFCREYNIKGFSKLKKSELIEFILDSISEEEMDQIIEKKELEIVTDGIRVALKIINGEDRERLTNIKVINPKEHEIELKFKGMNWENTSYLSITPENISNPERDCDCRIGSAMGLCNHFWVGVIFSFKQGWITLKEWNFTKLPEDFENTIKSIQVAGGNNKDEEESVRLINEKSDNFPLMERLDKSIMIYEGEVIGIEQKLQEFQDISTVYYLVALKNVRFGPKIAKKSDFREEDIVSMDSLNIRISEKLQEKNGLKQGDKVKTSGKLTKDGFLKMYVVKNIRKIEKL